MGHFWICESVHDPEERFSIEFFNVLMDQALMSLSERFEQFKGFQQDFSFLFKILCYMRSNRLDEVFPNVTTALRILLTAPITVASAERSFQN